MIAIRIACIALSLATPCIAAAQSIPVAPMATPPQVGAIPLGTGGVPGMPAESWFTLAGRPTVRNVSTATLLPVLPDKAKATGAAVVIAPGGGFVMESMEAEAMKPARWLADHGIAAFVLKYRLDATPAPMDAFKQAALARFAAAAAAEAKGGADIAAPAPALADAQTAMRLVRDRAAQWGIDPHRIAYMGFSAGAIMGIDLVKTAAPGTLPDLLAAIYPSMAPATVPAAAPPLFVAVASDDELFGKQGYGLPDSWRRHGRPVELHVYEHGGHGFGFDGKPGTTSTGWNAALLGWLRAHGWLDRQK
ncbi:acetyl esterase/lipase [Sphingomonas jinjuensis]|uniref:Acetyl esterase/lipase n=1 Tax=Sphingomonas jinjuensis TaxID=535907 RepID=A0A840F4S2_9SPHN|nr:dienelactone hydrolase family protein [Sphingomonas jinjuensis]MBB4154303.1 acetyl esterase/lipase [Sphingomonas jinjuensis]